MAPDWAGPAGVSIVARGYRVTMNLSEEDYTRLLALRTGLRHFQRWSEQQAQNAGLTPAQHQLLLAIRGHPDRRGPTVGEVADYLLLRHHSTVELADRADSAGLVRRNRDPDDRRIVRLQLTELGAETLEGLSALHVQELERLARRLPSIWEGLTPVRQIHGMRATSERPPQKSTWPGSTTTPHEPEDRRSSSTGSGREVSRRLTHRSTCG